MVSELYERAQVFLELTDKWYISFEAQGLGGFMKVFRVMANINILVRGDDEKQVRFMATKVLQELTPNPLDSHEIIEVVEIRE